VRLIFPPQVSPDEGGGPEHLTRAGLAALYAYPGRDRLWVRANMVTSADGAATIRGRSAGLSSDADRSLFALLRSLSDVILVGAGTARAERYSAARPDEMWPGLRDGAAPVPAIAVVTRRISLDLASPLVSAAMPEARTILITTEQAPPELRSQALKNADVIVAGDDSADLGYALRALAERGYHRVLAEGGPQLLGELAADELLDELCLTISPLVASGAAGRIAVGTSAAQSGRLVLQHVLEEEGHLFCRYTRRRPAIA
jgi:riboflavin biosynthesis pyrimidine reductase